eukprot:scaffold22833_cov134-Isochrysis_galbana.AAC.3
MVPSWPSGSEHASPKSMSLSAVGSSTQSMTFSSLTSRWTTPLPMQWASAEAIFKAMGRVAFSDRVPESMSRSKSSPPPIRSTNIHDTEAESST